MATRAIVDGRNMLRADVAALGFGYEGIGRKTSAVQASRAHSELATACDDVRDDRCHGRPAGVTSFCDGVNRRRWPSVEL